MGKRRVLVFTIALACIATPSVAGPVETGTAAYAVSGVRTVEQRSQIARIGAAIDEVEEHGTVVVTATKAEVRAMKAQGFGVEEVPVRTEEGAAVISA